MTRLGNRTYTYVEMEVSQSAYDEIKAKLEEADYHHALMEDGTLDMNGIGLTAKVPYMHPRRYPQHEGNKGQVFGGVCNTTKCSNLSACYWNSQTYGYYCVTCAAGINFHPREPDLCTRVHHQLEERDMENHYTRWAAAKALGTTELGDLP